MARRTSFSSEFFLYLLILLLAFGLRFAKLNEAPLTEFEAQAAYPAHALASGQSVDLADQPGYVLLTSPLFALLGSSEALARLLPALFGLALVALPYFWRDLLGQKVALILSLAWAVDPGMVAMSRLAGGTMIGISAALIALTAWRYSRPIAAGIFFSIAWLASPVIFLGVIPALLVWLVVLPRPKIDISRLRPFFLAAVLTLLIGGTLIFQAPEGLSGTGNTISAFIAGFGNTGVPIPEIGLALLGYTLPALVFGVIGAINAWRTNHTIGKVTSLFAFFSLLLVIVYPGRQVADLLWAVLALWALAAIQISSYLSLPEKDLIVALGEAGLMLLLGIFFGIALTKVAANYADFIWVAAATLILAVLATVLIAFGWSRMGAERGFVWALLLFSVLFLLSAGSRFLRVDVTDANDLWAPGPAAGSDRLFSDSLHDLSTLNQGLPNDLSVESQVDNAAITWELRDLQSAGSNEGNPPLVVTAAMETQSDALSAYRGQSFGIRVQRAWTGWPPSFFAWLFYRQAPTQTEQIILWARADLFPDSPGISELAPDQMP